MLSRLVQWVSNSGICAVAGSIAGGIAGLMFGLSMLAFPSHTLTLRQALLIGAILGIVAWLAVLFLLLAFGRYSARTVLWRSFVTCVLASIFTVLVINALHLTLLGMLVGWIIGFLIGRALCTLCQVRAVRAKS